MHAYRLTLGGVAALALAASVLAPAAAAAGRPAPAKSSTSSCTSTSSTGTSPSKYNRTPKGAGPWHVALDPCNTEGSGSGKTPYYDCAYWAAEKRPDVWTNAVWKYGYSQSHPGAWRIKVDAEKAGYPVNHTPTAGDIAAWGPNAKMGTTASGTYFTASPGGHVAYVEKVLSNGRITISSMGQGNTGGYTTTIAFSNETSFIHQLH